MATLPLLSIIITVYNLENYIEECLQSVVNQNIDECEILLVDNGSTDRSLEICERYARQYPVIKYIRLDNDSRIGRAHRMGLLESRGRYIHMLDGDDLVEIGCYRDIVGIIKSKEPDLIFGSFQSKIEEGGKNINDAVIDPKKINDVEYEDALAYLMKVPNFHMVAWRYIYRKDLFSEERLTNFKARAQVIPSNAYGDVLTTVQLLICSQAIYFYEKPFYYYRIRNKGSVTSQLTAQHYYDFFNTFLVLLYIVLSFQCTGVRKAFVLSKAKLLFDLFLSGLDLFQKKDFSRIADLIEMRQTWLFPLIRDIELVDVRAFYQILSRYGINQGIEEFCFAQNQKIVSALPTNQNYNFFVFPTGNYGEAYARVLRKAGRQVLGFFDNDQLKSGIVIDGILCYHPNQSYQLGFHNNKDNIVIIATIYRELRLNLKKQLLAQGWEESQIIVKE